MYMIHIPARYIYHIYIYTHTHTRKITHMPKFPGCSYIPIYMCIYQGVHIYPYIYIYIYTRKIIQTPNIPLGTHQEHIRNTFCQIIQTPNFPLGTHQEHIRNTFCQIIQTPNFPGCSYIPKTLNPKPLYICIIKVFIYTQIYTHVYIYPEDNKHAQLPRVFLYTHKHKGVVPIYIHIYPEDNKHAQLPKVFLKPWQRSVHCLARFLFLFIYLLIISYFPEATAALCSLPHSFFFFSIYFFFFLFS